MTVGVLYSKLRTGFVTGSSVEYKGSITIDENIMDDLGIVEWQECDVNSRDGFRGTTYVLKGKRGTGCVEANGALASHVFKGDIVHINFYAQMSMEAAKEWSPIIVESNKPYMKK